MWKSSSRNISAKLSAVSRRKANVRCTFATEQAGSPSQSDPPREEFHQKERPRRSTGKFAFQTFGVLTAATAGVVGYAWYNHEFRHKVTTNVPFTKDALDAVFVFLPESPSVPAAIISEKADNPKPQIDVDEQKSFMRKKSPAPMTETQGDVVPSSGAQPLKPEPKSDTLTIPPAVPVKGEEQKRETVEEKRNLTDKEIQELKKKAEKEAEEKKKSDALAENAALEVAIESLIDITSVSVQKALSAIDDTIVATKQHTEMLKIAMNDKSSGSEEKWDTVVAAYNTVEKTTYVGDKAVAQAWADVEKLRNKLDAGRESELTKTNQILKTGRDKHNKFRKDLTSKIEQLSKVERDSKAQLQFRSLVEKGKQQFKKEIESLSPNMSLMKGGKPTVEELNLMIAHAHSRIEQLQKELAEQAAFEKQRAAEVLEKRQANDQKLIDEAIKEEKEKMKFQFDNEMQEKDKEIREKYHRVMIDERYRMEEWWERETDRKIKEKEDELTRKYQQIVEVVKVLEREQFLAEMAEWIGRIKGFDKAISSRAQTEELAEQAQKLWLACLALNGAIRVGNYSGETMEEQLKPLEKQVDAVFDAAQNNPLICLVLQTIPEKALTRGVFTEDNLKLRFGKVYRVARRLALIDETGGSLFKYFISWMQSFFVASGNFTVKAKSEEDQIDLADMDTFEILENARHWVEKGDLEVALKFMNQLKGESRRVASDWIEETRLLLETRQASFTLMAFASAQGLGTLF